jgi:hypothetical protein
MVGWSAVGVGRPSLPIMVIHHRQCNLQAPSAVTLASALGRCMSLFANTTRYSCLVVGALLYYNLPAPFRPKCMHDTAVVVRTFAWLTRCLQLNKDYEVLPSRSKAMIYLAMTRLMIWRLGEYSLAKMTISLPKQPTDYSSASPLVG